MFSNSKIEKKYNCVISIYLTLTFVCIISLLFVLIESSRIRAAALYYQYAANNAVDSMMSLYHIDLWEKYRIFGIEYNVEDLLKKEYNYYLNKHMSRNDDYVKNFYPAEYKDSNMFFTRVIDQYNFENEIIDYMKIAIGGILIDFAGQKFNMSSDADVDKFSSVLESISKNSVSKEKLNKISKKYEIQADEFLKLDNCVSNIYSAVNNINKFFPEFASRLHSGAFDAIISTIMKIEKEYYDIQSQVSQYFEQEEILLKRINEYENDFNSRQSDFNNEEKILINQQLQYYKDYFNNEEVAALRNNLRIKEKEIFELTTIISGIHEIIELFQMELEEAKDIEDSDERDDYIASIKEECVDSLMEYAEYFKDFKIENVNELSYGVNKTLITSLKSIKSFLNKSIISLVLPEGYNIPNSGYSTSNKKIDSKLSAIDKLLYTEYCFNYNNFYLRKSFQKRDLIDLRENLELEYVISGQNTNQSAISNILYRTLAIREACNMVHILTSPKKMEILSKQLSLISINPALSAAYAMLFVSVWALLQSIYDLKLLCSAEKVPLMHSEDSWDIDGSLIFSEEANLLSIQKKNRSGMSYKDYLRLYLFLLPNETLNSRIANVIETNLKKDEQVFTIDNLAYSLSYKNKFELKPLMTLFKVFDSINIKKIAGYEIEVDTYQSFESEWRNATR